MVLTGCFCDLQGDQRKVQEIRGFEEAELDGEEGGAVYEGK